MGQQGSSAELSQRELVVITKLLELYKESVRRVAIDDLARYVGEPPTTLNSIVMLLASKGLVSIDESQITELELTKRGFEALEHGLPEELVVRELLGGPRQINQLKSTLGDQLGPSLRVAVSEGYVKVEGGLARLVNQDASRKIEEIKEALRGLSEGRAPSPDVAEILARRGLAKAKARKVRFISLTEQAIELAQRGAFEVYISKLTHEDLVTGRWKSSKIKPYDVTAEPPHILPARKHPLAEFIEELRDIMVSMGFEEVEGPLVELELFNFDALFQPQDHPAREIQDTLWPDLPSADLKPYSELVERVREEHEKGWGYAWNPAIASRYILRSQTTAVSVRTLLERHEPPVRAFTIDKVFRADPVDSTHLSDFHQLDGIIGDRGFTFRDLLGVLKEFARRLGLNITFKPAYFPFTEPSVEGYANIGGRLVEVFGAGLFRPEVLRIVGADFPVGAWGMGVERLALAKLGLNDVRQLYSNDIDFLRGLKAEVE